MGREKKISVFAAAWMLLVLMVWMYFGLPLKASAEETVTAGTSVLRIDCRGEDHDLVSGHWRMYTIGEKTSDGIVLTGVFKDRCDINTADNSEKLAEAALSLLEVADRSESTVLTAYTGEDGTAVFSGLGRGVYLVAGSDVRVGDRYLGAVPVIIAIEDGEQRTIIPKFGYKDGGGSTDTFDTPKQGDEPPGSKTDGGGETGTPDTGGSTPDTSSQESGSGSGGGSGDSDGSTGDRDLTEDLVPGTGQMWWPAPTFGMIGVALIMFGTRLHSSEESDDDEDHEDEKENKK